tara:strand:- start:230 stop:1960 length:1731 start_codon:yes stop_codon:yes gene_type:complete
MSAQSIQPAFTTFKDIDGSPLESGMIYIGTAGLNAVTNQITVYSDKALSVALSQPITTRGGYPVVSGTPIAIYTGVDDFSIAINNKHNSTVTTALNKTQFLSSASVTYKSALTGSVSREVSSKLGEHVNVKDFGAVGDGVTDDSAAFVAALAAANTVFIPEGDYVVGNIALASNKQLYGECQIFTRLLANANNVDMFVVTNSSTLIVLDNFSALANGFTGVDFFNQINQSLYVARCTFSRLNLHGDIEYCFKGAFIYGLWKEVTTGLSGGTASIHVFLLGKDDSAAPASGHALNFNRMENCRSSGGASTVSGEAMVNVINGDSFSFDSCSFEGSTIPILAAESVRNILFESCWFEAITVNSMFTLASGGLGGHTSSMAFNSCHFSLSSGPTVSVFAGDAATSMAVENSTMLLGAAGLTMFSGGTSVRAISNLTYDSAPSTLLYPASTPTDGDWTPAFLNVGTGTYSVQAGEYTRTGNIVVCTGSLAMSALGTASGALVITGLPFASRAGFNNVTSVAMQNMSTGKPNSVCFVSSASTQVKIYDGAGTTGAFSATAVTHAHLGGTGEVYFSITYRVD